MSRCCQSEDEEGLHMPCVYITSKKTIKHEIFSSFEACLDPCFDHVVQL
jgi:hypothetical protein